MNDEEKLQQLFEVFESEDINADTELDTLQWDSMAMLSVMAIIKSNGKSVTRQEMREMKTIGDILVAM